MTHLTSSLLRRYVAGYPAFPPRTIALEQRINIGTGFHGKWYRSQKEHWLGWLLAKECEARSRGLGASSSSAKTRYQFILCSPAIFWLAECAGVPGHRLDEAEAAAECAAAINGRDGHPHGALMRMALPWPLLASAMSNGPAPASEETANEISRAAFDHLCANLSRYRSLKAWLR